MAKSTKLRKSKKYLGPQTPLELLNILYKNKYKKTDDEKKLVNFATKGLKMPARATVGHLVQAEYIYYEMPGYEIIIQTAMVDGKLNPKGVASIQIKNTSTEEKFLFHEFYKISFASIAKMLSVYAPVFRAIVSNIPEGMEIHALTKYKICFKSKTGKAMQPFVIKDYLYVLTDEQKKFFLKKESRRNSYIKVTQPLVDAEIMKRQWQIQKPWKAAKE